MIQFSVSSDLKLQNYSSFFTVLSQDLDAETLAHINAENEAQSLKDELEFIKEVHEAVRAEITL